MAEFAGQLPSIAARPQTRRWSPDQPGLRYEKGRSVGSLKVSRLIKDYCFFVGIHPLVTKKQMVRMVKLLRKFLNE